MKYIQEPRRNNDCVFCKALEQPDSAENLIVFRGENSFVILNRFPYTSGHLMVVPFQHCASMSELDQATRMELIEMVNRALLVLTKVYCPQGFNVGMNIGEPAGAGIADHIHMHIVPRWSGDTNFMSTVAGVRVLPEDLEQSYQRIKEVWDQEFHKEH
ncbi:MAG: HIT family protein [Anaerolineales bacterium]